MWQALHAVAQTWQDAVKHDAASERVWMLKDLTQMQQALMRIFANPFHSRRLASIRWSSSLCTTSGIINVHFGISWAILCKAYMCARTYMTPGHSRVSNAWVNMKPDMKLWTIEFPSGSLTGTQRFGPGPGPGLAQGSRRAMQLLITLLTALAALTGVLCARLVWTSARTRVRYDLWRIPGRGRGL